MPQIHGTTILAVRSETQFAMGGDGQVTLGDTVMKGTATKVRRLSGDRVLAGFAGSVSDAFALFGRFEEKLKEFNNNLLRAAVELGKDWRTDRYLRHLQAMLAVGDAERSLLISGNGDIIEPDDGILAIGSGGSYALAAARALKAHANLDAQGIVRAGLEIASDICVYTNNNISIEVLDAK